MSDLIKELRSYPEHYTAAHKAADSLEALEKKILDMQKDVDLLYALERAGVDNWSGFDHAIDILEGKDEC